MVTTKGRPPARRSQATTRGKGRGTGTARGRSGTDGGSAGRGRASAGGRGRGAQAAPDGLLRDHAADLWAIGLVTVGILLALALYGRAAGSVGHAVDVGLGAVVGWPRFLLPPVCAAAGVAILAGRHRPDPLRTGVGAGLGLLAVCGLAELAGGSPTASASTHQVSQAGGWLGVAVGRPLQLGLGTAGAVVVLVAVTVVGVVLSTGVSLGTVGRWLAAGWSAVARAARSRQERATPAEAVAPSAVATPAPALPFNVDAAPGEVAPGGETPADVAPAPEEPEDVTPVPDTGEVPVVEAAPRKARRRAGAGPGDG
ncbi:MAG: DNA translocase FtsK 4TM domain-containing protein, partial [Acidimicrobiales bacterium]